MNMIGSVSAEKLLGMQIDLNTKLRSGALTVDELDSFLNRRSPFGILSAYEATAKGLLQYIGNVQLPNLDGFVNSQCFNESNPAGVKFAPFEEKFLRLFVGQGGSEEYRQGEFSYYKTIDLARDITIIRALGPRFETSLALIWSLLKKQPKGQPGTLLTYGGNMFFVRDWDGHLWQLVVGWSHDENNGWKIYMYNIGGSGYISANWQIFG